MCVRGTITLHANHKPLFRSHSTPSQGQPISVGLGAGRRCAGVLSQASDLLHGIIWGGISRRARGRERERERGLHIYIHIYLSIFIFIYLQRHREREGERERQRETESERERERERFLGVEDYVGIVNFQIRTGRCIQGERIPHERISVTGALKIGTPLQHQDNCRLLMFWLGFNKSLP